MALLSAAAAAGAELAAVEDVGLPIWGMSLREREWPGGAWLGLSGWLSMPVLPLCVKECVK